MNTQDDASGLAMLETMMLIRAYETQLVAINQATGAAGTCTSVGQEAAAVGVVHALDERDRLLTNHRSAGHLLARGADPGRLIAEVLGRVDGYCGGKSGSLHISARELGVVLTSTIVGGELAMAPGVALAQKMSAEGSRPGGIVAAFFGDGAACEGIFHEALNLAVLWRLPLLFVCENNQWQAFVPSRQAMAVQDVRSWAEGHGIAALTVDGNDVETVYAASRRAVDAIRATGQPFFLELQTYRQRGHFEPDDQAYVDRDELTRWQLRDPIALQSDRLLERGLLDADALAQMRERTAAAIANAAAFAQASPWPEPSELTTQVHA